MSIKNKRQSTFVSNLSRTSVPCSPHASVPDHSGIPLNYLGGTRAASSAPSDGASTIDKPAPPNSHFPLTV